MPAELHDFLARDHERLDRLLSQSLQSDGTVNQEAYAEFRHGLLRHIAIEEKVLFPELRVRMDRTELERQLHRDHAALAALLVPPPTRSEVERITAILQVHNELEEVSGGLYDIVEGLVGDDLPALMSRVRSIPAVRVAPHIDTPIVRSSIEQLVREAEEGRRRIVPGHNDP